MTYIGIPDEGESSRRQIDATDQATDALVHEPCTGASETRPYTASDRAHSASVCAQHRLEKEFPTLRSPGEGESSRRQIVATDRATDALAYELYGLTGLRTGGSETRPYTPSDRAHRASVCAQH